MWCVVCGALVYVVCVVLRSVATVVYLSVVSELSVVLGSCVIAVVCGVGCIW